VRVVLPEKKLVKLDEQDWYPVYAVVEGDVWCDARAMLTDEQIERLRKARQELQAINRIIDKAIQEYEENGNP